VEDPACLYEVGKTVLCYEDDQSRVYRPLGDGGDSGNFSHDETETASPNRSSYRSNDSETFPDAAAQNGCIVSVSAQIPDDTPPKSPSRL
ncbi:hypothetical protein M9458_049821, partial [Cirrhinus mrigala]